MAYGGRRSGDEIGNGFGRDESAAPNEDAGQRPVDHFKALDLLSEYIPDGAVLNLLCQVMRRSTTRGGIYRDYLQGISRGCPLSPLIGAFYLHALDRQMEQLDLFYVRYMDDILVLAPTRWKLRKAVRLVNQELDELKLDKHPDKTFIGRIDKGFDFLGYHARPDGLSVAQATLDRFMERATRLYEQEKGKPEGFPVLGLYVVRWVRWACSGQGACKHADLFGPSASGV